jgi:hypothetical protein
MGKAVKIAQMLVRITGLIQIVLGLLFWVGLAKTLVLVHIASGLVLVISLWVIAALTGRAGARLWMVGLAVVLGIGVAWLGLTQGQLLPGPAHWVIQVIHLLAGLLAIGLAEGLAPRPTRSAKLAT